MMKRIVIAGSRNFDNYERLKSEMDTILRFYDVKNEITIVSGGCRGADALGERYAKENGIPLEIIEADWDRYGAAAGPIRNEEMVKLSDAITCFWDGKSKGTKSLIELAKQYKKPLKIIYT